MENILTLIAAPGSLNAAIAERANSILTLRGANVGEIDWLAPETACDLPFDHFQTELAVAAVREVFVDQPIDVVAQPSAGRRKHLLVADMESTIIENEMLDELASELGIHDRIATITARAMAGELDFESAIRERVAMLKGMDSAALNRAISTIRIMPGAAILVATMRANGAHCALVSGGFDFFTGWVRERLGFDEDQANRLEITNGILTGKLHDPILGRVAKREALARLTAKLGIDESDAVTVGDGANDLDMLAAAGLGVAFRAKPIVAESARARIDHGDLTALLYLQGYRQGDFRGG